MTTFEKLVIKLLAAIYNSVRGEGTHAVGVRPYGGVFDSVTEEEW